MGQNSFLDKRFLVEEDSEDGHFGVHIGYYDLYSSMVFLAAVYASGVFSTRFLGMPALVGETLIGIFLGPNLFNLVPLPEAFVLLGEIGYDRKLQHGLLVCFGVCDS